ALEIQPALVWWQQGEAPKPKTITVRAGKDVTLTKVSVNSNVPEFQAEVEKSSKPGEFTIKVQPKNTDEPRNAMLTITSDVPQPFYATARIMTEVPQSR
ncbi:MAG TPA: hypothetical protein VF551_00690, partial [Chthoniobacterales bacterium]